MYYADTDFTANSTENQLCTQTYLQQWIFDRLAPAWDENEHTPTDKIEKLIIFCNLKRGEKVLDVGCGTGIISGLLMKKCGDVTAIDVSEKMLDIARLKHLNSGIRFGLKDFYDFDESGFDCVVIYNAYPHFLDRSLLAEKLSSVLRTGGRFYILNSCGKDEINGSHSGAMSVSHTLLSVEDEFKYFENMFNVAFSADKNDFCAIEGIKK